MLCDIAAMNQITQKGCSRLISLWCTCTYSIPLHVSNLSGVLSSMCGLGPYCNMESRPTTCNSSHFAEAGLGTRLHTYIRTIRTIHTVHTVGKLLWGEMLFEGMW